MAREIIIKRLTSGLQLRSILLAIVHDIDLFVIKAIFVFLILCVTIYWLFFNNFPSFRYVRIVSYEVYTLFGNSLEIVYVFANFLLEV